MLAVRLEHLAAGEDGAGDRPGRTGKLGHAEVLRA